MIRCFVILNKIKRSDCHVDDKIRKKGRKKKLFPDNTPFLRSEVLCRPETGCWYRYVMIRDVVHLFFEIRDGFRKEGERVI